VSATSKRILVTGSADGLGVMAARDLIAQGHAVTLHARSPTRAQEALAAAPGAAGALHGDLASLAQTRALADQANALDGAFDAVIHNAGIGYREPHRVTTEDGLEHVFQINVLAPYVLTALIARPARLVCLSSGLHRSGDPRGLDDPQWERRPWDGLQAYADSKLYDAMLAAAIARRWPAVRSNALEPGWVATTRTPRSTTTTSKSVSWRSARPRAVSSCRTPTRSRAPRGWSQRPVDTTSLPATRSCSMSSWAVAISSMV
jgi:NAD(P)-dependent dehydrogenase (short-subunit alcohol dehydrogenase family)